MKKELQLPSHCSALTEEEMTYTTGGALNLGDALSGTFQVLSGIATIAGVVVLGSAYVWGLRQSRAWLDKEENREGNFFTVMGRATDAVLADMRVSPTNFVRDLVSTGTMIVLWPVTALVLILS